MKDLEARFAELEKRVTKLISDNNGLRKRVSALEQELAKARSESEELRNYQGERIEIRERIQRMLLTLEGIGQKES